MLAEAIYQEVAARANSQEGMEALIHSLLFARPMLTIDEAMLLDALKDYVYAKRCLEIRDNIWKHPEKSRNLFFMDTGIPCITSTEFEVARDTWRNAERLVSGWMGAEHVALLKKRWGRVLSFKYLRYHPSNADLNREDVC